MRQKLALSRGPSCVEYCACHLPSIRACVCGCSDSCGMASPERRWRIHLPIIFHHLGGHWLSCKKTPRGDITLLLGNLRLKNTRPFASIVGHGERLSVEPYPKLNYSTQLRLNMTFLNCAVKPWKPQNKAEKIEDPNWVHDVIEDTLLSWSGTSCLCFRTRPKSSSADTVCWHPYNIHIDTLAIWKIPPFSSWVHIGLLVTSLGLHAK